MNAYDELKKDIILGTLKPGEVFNEKEYAAKLNVSRTPIREAILKLAEEGYVQILPRKGTLISTISLNDILAIYEFRLLLEPNILLLLKDKTIDESWIDDQISLFEEMKKETPPILETIENDHDKDFHIGLARFTKNAYIEKEMSNIMDRCLRIRTLSSQESKKRYVESLDEHLKILSALKEKDVGKASMMMKKHLKNTLNGFSFLGANN